VRLDGGVGAFAAGEVLADFASLVAALLSAGRFGAA
jgi:hypothetical protein